MHYLGMVCRDEAHPAHVSCQGVYLISITRSPQTIVPAPKVQQLESVGSSLAVLRVFDVYGTNPLPLSLQEGDKVMADESARASDQDST